MLSREVPGKVEAPFLSILQRVLWQPLKRTSFLAAITAVDEEDGQASVSTLGSEKTGMTLSAENF